MRADTADQHVVAVVQQVLRGDGGAEETVACLHVLRRFFGGDVFEDDFQFREVTADRLHHLFDKARLAVENIDGRIGHFTVHQQRQADFLHLLEQRVNAGHVADAVAGVGGGVGRIQLGGGKHPLLETADQFTGRQRVGQVTGHQRSEVVTLRHRRQNPIAVGACGGHGRHGRNQVRHHDRPAKYLAGIGHHRFQHLIVTQVDMPVVWAADFQNLRLCGHLARLRRSITSNEKRIMGLFTPGCKDKRKVPQMHLFVGDKLKSTAQQAHSDNDFNDADANTVDFHQVEREKTMEVRVIATLQAKAGFEAAVSEAVHDILEPSRQELGNLQYDLHRDLEKPGTFVFFERWASSEALDKHNETAHFQQFVSRLDGKLDVLDIKKLKKIA